MAILEFLTSPLADGTAITSGNSGMNSITNGGSSSTTWQSGKVVLNGAAGQSCLARATLSATNNDMQFTGQWTTPAAPVASAATIIAFRWASGRICDIKTNANRAITFADFVNTASTIIPASTVSDATEYVVKVDYSGGSTTTGDVLVRFETLAGVLIGSEFHLSNSNLSTNPFSAIEIGGTNTPAINHAWRNLRINNGPGAYLDKYAASVQLDAPPTPTVTAKSNPTTIAGSDGSITIAWSNVANAGSYEVSSSTNTTFTGGTAGTSPYTFTGLSAGARNFAVRAMP